MSITTFLILVITHNQDCDVFIVVIKYIRMTIIHIDFVQDKQLSIYLFSTSAFNCFLSFFPIASLSLFSPFCLLRVRHHQMISFLDLSLLSKANGILDLGFSLAVL